MTDDYRPVGREKTSHVTIKVESIRGRGKSQFEGSELGVCPVCLSRTCGSRCDELD